jgi:hypothetical protein
MHMENKTAPIMPKIDRQGKILFPSYWHALTENILRDPTSSATAQALAHLIADTHGQRAVRDL